MPAPSARVVFLWHMHQPSYESPDGSPPAMPWVRLHATRAYRDLAWIFQDHPQVRMVVNFVPCLLDQLERVVAGSTDAFRELTRRDPATLTAEERRFLATHFFSCRQETLIDPLPRYAELLQHRDAVLSWSHQDLLDLQVHFNLAWLGPAARAEEPLLPALLRQGRNYTIAQRDGLLACQDRVCARILPEWRRLAASGQIELTTTPYYHPILPLLLDSDVARRCQPGAALPPRFSWPEDAREQVDRAVSRHTQLFGQPPRGLWPAEGSVSPEAVHLIHEAGLKWLATDEGILLHSLPPGTVREHVLCRPYRFSETGPLLLFRDRDLSDRIGFTYARDPASHAVADLLMRLEAAGRASLERRDHPPRGPVLLVALDGENPWEGYPDGGVEFLHLLCRQLETHPLLTTLLPRDLELAEATPLPRLHTGSWIESTFRIWIGGPVENRAWALLGAAREALAGALQGQHPRAAEAREALLGAEGSDWFWWFGDDFSTTQDELFDQLFRARLRRVYELLDLPVPPELYQRVDERRRTLTGDSDTVAVPAGFIQPALDGRVSGYYEWAGAVEVPLGGGRAAMYQGARRFSRLLYGFSLEQLFLRLDRLPASPTSEPHACRLRLLWGGEARPLEIDFVLPPDAQELAQPVRTRTADGLVLAVGKVLELAIPLEALGARPGELLELELLYEEDGHVVDRAPGQGRLRIRLPDENVFSWSWML
ncbi:MAG: glycoside hydrolase family 57 protein [Myxococcota bacterium]|nr:glycoside hydrolase family 57 protein [Myxococcota bacterium]